ncbi:hypothetical protein ABFS83_09G082800 [Erythranthe nasuta]
MKSISSWICTNSAKNLFVKIVHQGGRVELFDRPVTAADVLQRNPKCCVAHPTVFDRPHDIVPPTTTLALGRKYYVVPVSTIKKLQLKSNYDHGRKTTRNKDDGDSNRKKMESLNCWLVRNDNDTKNGGTRVSLTSCDQWRPGLESIREE